MASPSEARAAAEALRTGLETMTRGERRRTPPAVLAESFNRLLAITKELLPHADQLLLPQRVQTTWRDGEECSVADYPTLRVYALTIANLLAIHFPDALAIPASTSEASIAHEKEFFAWTDVDSARSNAALQASRELERTFFIDSYMVGIECRSCGRTEDDLEWFYFRTPDEAWSNSLGYGGWMVVCDSCHEQVAFFLDDYG